MQRWDDERMDQVIGGLLRAGVLAAAALVLVGSLLYFANTTGATLEPYRVFRGAPEEVRGIVGVAREAMRGTSRGLIQLGVLVLVATPVARVALCVFAFAVQRDRLYIAITLVVLAVLAFSLFGSTEIEDAPHGRQAEKLVDAPAAQKTARPPEPVEPVSLGAARASP